MKEEKPKYIGSWKGRVIKAIAIDSAYTWDEIRDSTGLSADKLNLVLRELFNEDAVKKIKKDDQTEYRVKKSLYDKYKSYYENEGKQGKVVPVVKISEKIQEDLVQMIKAWKNLKDLNIDLNKKHFYLEGRFLDELSKDVITKAKTEVLIVNPWIRKCDLSGTLRESVKKGVTVTVILRPPDKNKYEYEKDDKFHSLLKDEGIKLYYNESVHAKIIVIDKALAIVSSMNFTVQSSGGQSWEAGMVTIDHAVIDDIVNSILNLIERRDTIEV